MVCIISYSSDLHALAIQRAIRQQGTCDCQILETDKIAQRNSISLRLSGAQIAGFARSSDQTRIDLASVGALWLRRPQAAQILKFDVEDATAVAVMENDSNGALKGLLVSGFNGKWISGFDALIRASDKISQLRAAANAGFRIPDTLVSQSRDEVLSFEQAHRETGGIIVKTVVGAEGPFLLTRRLTDVSQYAAEAFQAAPAIYQECIPGERHIRLQCFGEQCLAASIDSAELDWRPDLRIPVSPWNVSAVLQQMTRRTLDALGLEMGVIDLKVTPDGEIVWLEVNPQGQFLFLEPLARMNIAEPFARYLIDQAGERTN